MGAGLWPGSLLSAQASTFEWFWKRGHRAEMLSPSAQWLPAMWTGGQTGHLGELNPEDKLSHGFHRYQGSCGGQATVGRATGLKPIHTIPPALGQAPLLLSHAQIMHTYDDHWVSPGSQPPSTLTLAMHTTQCKRK